MMAHDLQRPEHARASYNYFSKADDIARKADLKDVRGRILADWSLLYSENGQPIEAKQTIDKALSLAPQDANVNVDYAVHLFRNHLYPEVQKYIEKALFLDPSNWQALWYQVKLSESFSDLKKEKETLSEIVRYYPWSKVAQDKLKALTEQVK
jgi:tetratricopeptide (TPR) repeat protein